MKNAGKILPLATAIFATMLVVDAMDRTKDYRRDHARHRPRNRTGETQATIRVDVTFEETLELEAKPKMTVDQFKSSIKKEKGIAKEMQRLILKGRELRDDEDVYEALSKAKTDAITLVTGLVVEVKALTGEIFKLQATPRMTVDQFKSSVNELKGIAKEMQRLIPKGQKNELRDDENMYEALRNANTNSVTLIIGRRA